ncbi:hypothetical protein N9917_00925 [Deltaproteobacteria bacterium]|nr:hypothetical protein [Deltaproteobacteria bacterium]
MAFRKTSIALTHRVIPQDEAAGLVTASQLPGDHPPAHPKTGDVWDGMIWDGGAWVTQAVWAKTKAEG